MAPVKKGSITPLHGEDMLKARIYGCIQSAKAIAENKEQLCQLIPLLLSHNDLPLINIPRIPCTTIPRKKTPVLSTTPKRPIITSPTFGPNESSRYSATSPTYS